MGCGGSKKHHGHLMGLLTEQDRHNLQHSWKHFTTAPLVDGALDIFFYLFKKHPELQRLFHFVKMDEPEDSLRSNHRFCSHVGLFCETITICVEEMRDLEEILIFLKDLGARHNMYGATPEYIQSAGEALQYALKKKLRKKFTSEVQKSWSKFYKILSSSMISGMSEDNALNVPKLKQETA